MEVGIIRSNCFVDLIVNFRFRREREGEGEGEGERVGERLGGAAVTINSLNYLFNQIKLLFE